MRTLTAKGAATRQRIIEGTAAEIRESGVLDLTLDDVSARTRTSRSQLFHYFPGGKDELLLAVARLEADRVLADQQPQLGELTSWRSWREWRDKVVGRYRDQGSHCPLNVVMSQLSRTTPGAQAVVAQLIERWEAELAAGVRHMQGTGEIDPALDAGRAAAALLAGVQGGVAILLATGQIGYLEAALDSGLQSLRAGPGR
ncbi:TetR/AcrR family transcriptional regulator [Nonomuraea sp. NPDC050404]|uniref:TetR/AcrR family transcriptional regulator n=1 Tax=Nonomuraea sp. NPDC050404 TaxID=3155783 RepID=UPI0033C45BF3